MKHLSILLLLPLLLPIGCGKESKPTRPPDPDPIPARMVISPPSGLLTAIGQTLQLTAKLLDTDGNTLAGYAISWSGSAAAVATVDRNGLVTARSDGTTRITAAWGGIQTNVTVTVARSPARIILAQTSVVLTSQGKTITLKAVIVDSGGTEIPDAPQTWTSENSAVASVDNQGVVTAHMEGETRITITSGDQSASVAVTVELEKNRLIASPETVILHSIGVMFELNAVVIDENRMAVPGVVFAWTSEDPSIATVDNQGIVTVRMNGQTTIRATWESLSDSIMVTVAQQADHIVVSMESVHLVSIGDMIELTATVFDANETEIQGAELTWSSEDPAVASVDDQGVVTAHMTGTTRITLTSGMVTTGVGVTVGDVASDRDLLVEFYNATGGPGWKNNTNWLTDMPLSEWHGIDTDSTGRVEVIWLLNNGLKGELPASLGNLTNLEVIGISQNELKGEIPAELGNLKSLERLILGTTGLTGSIPSSLGGLTELSVLDLQLNQLSGGIPATLGNLTNLTYLRLTGNPLGGTIPPSLGRLDKLQRLFLSGAGLAGQIPAEFGGLASLKEMYLTHNDLTGTLPEALGRLEHLVSLRLTDNAGLTGPLPRTYLNLELLSLHLFGTQVCIPRDLAFEAWLFSFHDRFVMQCEAGPDLAALEAMYTWMGGSNWTNKTNWRSARPISEWFGVSVNSSGRIESISLPGNGLKGNIQGAISGLADLERLNLGNNDLSGSIPGALGQLENLRELKLNDNPRLSGSISKELTSLDLSALWLQGTVVCATGDPDIQAWIQGIADARVADCVRSTSDRDVLVALYNATDGANWSRNDNWLSNMPISDWYGVVTNSAGRVRRLDVGFNGLNGRIPSSVGSLAELRWLNLSDNSLSGTIPTSLGGLGKLEFAYLQRNDLSGGIPSQLGNLSQLQLLNLSENPLGGTIPGSLGDLANLEILSLYGVQLAGAIPASLSRLSSLEYLYLGGNSLSGAIPGSLRNLTNLIELGLSSNGFTGGIPSGLGSLSSLEKLYLHNNRLDGGVPSSLGSLGALTLLDLSGNDLSGSLPASLGNLVNLETLKLGNNAGLTGPLPHGLVNSRLTTLLAGGTDLCAPPDDRFQDWLRGVRNRSISRCPLLSDDRETLIALYNATDGPNWRFRPKWAGNEPITEWGGVTVDSTGRVSHLSLSSVGLRGEIPSSLANLDGLQSLYLSRNHLNGSIPAELGNLTHLRLLFLHANELSGTIPSALGDLENLEGLGLDSNMLTGSIPSSFGDLTKVRSLYLENNKLSGNIPASLGNLTNLELLWVHNNADMSGSLPGALTGMTSLTTLRLDGTGLCVPNTEAFQTWLDGIETKQFEYCE